MSQKPLTALIILDGFGWREEDADNAVNQANKPNFDTYWNIYPHATLTACGEAVGLPEGQMGNSEVGHTNIGAGRIVYQSLTKINIAIRKGEFAQNEVLKKGMAYAKENQRAIHFMGLLSDGGIHSHINHLFALLEMAKDYDLERVYVHSFLDGRDVGPQTAKTYLLDLQEKLKQLQIGKMATISGRYYAMDRDKRWERVKKVYDAICYGEGMRFQDPLIAVDTSYKDDVFDEFVVPIVLTDENNEPIATLESGDVVVFFNFRPDRAIQLSNALTQSGFDSFDRGFSPPKHLHYICMTHFSETVNGTVAFAATDLTNTYGEIIANNGLKQLRIAETEKYPHVTFFFSGGREKEFEGETRILIHSPKVATYDLKPEMSAYEVGDACVQAVESGQFDTIILNFANPDMVGHSGILAATKKAVEAVDENLGKVVRAVLKQGGVCLITADHGNAEVMKQADGSPMTAHTTNPVPIIITKKGVTLRSDGILADLIPTMLDLLEIEQPPEMTGRSLIQK